MAFESPFLNREAELAALEDLWTANQAQLVIVYGRRRVGKTELLSRFCCGKRAHYFVATQTRDAEDLRAFVRVLRESMEFLQRAPADEWTPCIRIGGHWGRGVEVDVVTENLDGSHYVCECKWTTRPVGMGVLDQLRAASEGLPERLCRERRLVIFSRRGFSSALQARAKAEGVRLVSLAELFA